VNPPQFIEQLCRRYRVTPDFGRRLLPLAERAARSAPGKQRLICELIERSFAEEGRRMLLERTGSTPEEWAAVRTVAAILHAWNPPEWFERWDQPPQLGPQ